MRSRSWRSSRCAAEVENPRTSLIHGFVLAATLTPEIRRYFSPRSHRRISHHHPGNSVLNDCLNVARNGTWNTNLITSVSQRRTPGLSVLENLGGVGAGKLVIVLQGVGNELPLSIGAVVANVKLNCI